MKRLVFCLVSSFLLVLVHFGASFPAKNAPTPAQYFFILKRLAPQVQRVGILLEEDQEDQTNFLRQIDLAARANSCKVFVAKIKTLYDVAAQFQTLVSKYRVQVIWIPETGEILTSPVAQSYLIRKGMLNRILMIAPDSSWVDRGAGFTLIYGPRGFQPYANSNTLRALEISIPEEMQTKIQFAAN